MIEAKHLISKLVKVKWIKGFDEALLENGVGQTKKISLKPSDDLW